MKAGEELADKFKYHNWYLPSVGELMRMYWHARQGVNYDDDKIGAIFQKAIDAGILNDFSNSWYWSSSVGSQNDSWYVYFSNGSFGGNYKCNSLMVRAVAAFQPSPSLLTGEAKSNDCLHSDEALINMLRERGYKGELTKTLTI